MMLSNVWAKTVKAATAGQQIATQLSSYMGRKVKAVMVFPYGTHANVPANMLSLILPVQGSSDNRAQIAWDAQNRPELAEGEVAFYHPVTGSFAIWRDGGKLEVVASGDVDIVTEGNLTATALTATVTAPSITLDGNVSITGNITVVGDSTLAAAVTSNGVNIGSTHAHAQPNDSAGDTQSVTGPPQ